MRIYTATTAVAIALHGFVGLISAAKTVKDVEHTFYGYPDNSPPGPGTAYDCEGRGYVAGGNGSYDNPLTMASAPGEFDKCEIVWDPYTKKYLIMQDTCAKCTTQWKKKNKYHIDLYLGSTTHNDHQHVIDCEDALTPDNGQPVVRNPPKDCDADTRPLYSDGTNTCHTDRVFPQ